MNEKENTKYHLGTVSKALQVLDLFKKEKVLGITEIGRKLSIAKSNIFRIVITLEHWGYLEKTEDQKYKLGTAFAFFGNLVLERQEIISIARPFLQKLRDSHNETVHLSIQTPDNEVCFMLKENAVHSIQMASTVGLKMPLYITASGKVLLAFSQPAIIEAYISSCNFERKTNNTIVTKDKLKEKLDQIRKNGYGIDDEESEVGLICFAAPVKNIAGITIAAISMSGPAFRMRDNKKARVEAVKAAAGEISGALGYALQ
jgi:DNA-binding IclR family transcriptional regulator